MQLSKTTTVPPGNADAVLSQPILKMLVIVNDASLAQLADDLAQMPPIIDRRVIWFPNGLPASYQSQFNVSNLATALAFSLSPENSVGAVLRQGDIIDEVAMDDCYTAAGGL